MKYHSHPNRLLKDHLEEVRDISIDLVPKEYKSSIEIAALCHDFGKYTSYFQNYLQNKERSNLTNHGFISAVFGAYVGLNRLGEDKLLPLIIYNIILHHHGNLQSFENNLPSKFRNIGMDDFPLQLSGKIDAGIKQIEDIRNNINHIEEDMGALGLLHEFKCFLKEDNALVDTLAKLRRLDLLSIRNLKKENNYFIHQILYSALISADKLSASGTLIPDELFLDFDFLEGVRAKKFSKATKDEINQIRRNIYNTVLDRIDKNYDKSNIFSITAPTGTGKTITGCFAALKLNQLLGGDRKIIYALPFTSIIEQNYDVLLGLFENTLDFEKNPSSYIIKHHHLANLEYESEYRDYTSLEAQLLLENWTSGFIVTTFVQLLETLIGVRNRMLKKFSSIRGSIIILDEIQAIDIKYFDLVDYILKKACQYLDVKIIIMTATKPLILTESLELLINHEKYFQQFKRTKLIPKLNNITIDEFVDEFIDSLEEKSYLLVCNTIKQSIELYRQLAGLGRKVYYLSTNILPKHRRARIDEIESQLENGENIILVSTQVVEAGVDLDFDLVIRDIGPLDSIIQCAGRCNRNNRSEVGQVYVYSMIDEQGRQYARYVYGNSLINITKDILGDIDIIYENEYLHLINTYFDRVKRDKSMQVSEDFIKAINNLDFSQSEYSLDRFSLIKNNPSYIDVLFLYDDLVEKAYQRFLELSNIKNYERKRELYLHIQRDLKDYTISVPIQYVRDFTIDREMIILPREGIGQYYDDMTGFKRTEREECLIF